jgi:hypothetical protein
MFLVCCFFELCLKPIRVLLAASVQSLASSLQKAQLIERVRSAQQLPLGTTLLRRQTLMQRPCQKPLSLAGPPSHLFPSPEGEGQGDGEQLNQTEKSCAPSLHPDEIRAKRIFAITQRNRILKSDGAIITRINDTSATPRSTQKWVCGEKLIYPEVGR